MVFSSVEFLFYFLPIALILCCAVPMKFKNPMLALTGLVFYAWGEPIYVVVLIITAIVNYVAGVLMSKSENRRKLVLILSIILNLAILFIFKYTSFAVTTINSIFNISIPDPGLPLPIGISFFTFQSMSYTIDVYRGTCKPQRNFVNFFAYIAMFPQIVAGPIVKYQDVEEQLNQRTVSLSKFSEGVTIFVFGLAKKVLLANNIGTIWTEIKTMDYSEMPALTAWIGIISFTFQIYFDFSGYSDMAIGLGKMLGFDFMENFNLPYLSKSVSEFWRRWHISLGSWFREYVYFPLGGSREGTLKTVRNLLIVWMLTGLWHGASWNFVLWGLWFGILIVIEHLGFSKVLKKFPKPISWLYTMLAVVIGWVFFDTDSLSLGVQYLGAMFGAGGSFLNSQSSALLAEAAIPLALCLFFSSGATGNYISRLGGKDSKVVMAITPVATAALLIACTAYLVNSSYNPFLYFNF